MTRKSKPARELAAMSELRIIGRVVRRFSAVF